MSVKCQGLGGAFCPEGSRNPETVSEKQVVRFAGAFQWKVEGMAKEDEPDSQKQTGRSDDLTVASWVGGNRQRSGLLLA